MENKCNEKISENRQDSERYLMCLKEEHGSMVGGTGWICPLKLSCFEKKKVKFTISYDNNANFEI